MLFRKGYKYIICWFLLFTLLSPSVIQATHNLFHDHDHDHEVCCHLHVEADIEYGDYIFPCPIYDFELTSFERQCEIFISNKRIFLKEVVIYPIEQTYLCQVDKTSDDRAPPQNA